MGTFKLIVFPSIDGNAVNAEERSPRQGIRHIRAYKKGLPVFSGSILLFKSIVYNKEIAFLYVGVRFLLFCKATRRQDFHPGFRLVQVLVYQMQVPGLLIGHFGTEAKYNLSGLFRSSVNLHGLADTQCMAQFMAESTHKIRRLFVGRQHRIRIHPPAIHRSLAGCTHILAYGDFAEPIIPRGRIIHFGNLIRHPEQFFPVLQLLRHKINLGSLCLSVFHDY